MVDAAGAKPSLGDFKSAALAEQYIRRWYPNVLEKYLHIDGWSIVVAKYVEWAHHRDTRRIGGNQHHALL